MAFFQNVFDQEYQGYMVLGDRKLSLTFKVSPNRNMQSKMVAWNHGPYDLAVSGLLEFNFCWDPEYKNWVSVNIDVEGADASATTAWEVVTALNGDPTFSPLFVASVVSVGGGDSVGIERRSSKPSCRSYFGNGGAEVALGFNKKAGVAELPEYFTRHTIDNRINYPDSVGMLIKLDPGSVVDQALIENAGFFDGPMEDYELLRGRSGLFNFQNITVDGSDRIMQIIEYPAGAIAGGFGRKIQYEYTGSNKNPSQVTEVPHVLEEGDMVSPPSVSSSSSSS